MRGKQRNHLEEYGLRLILRPVLKYCFRHSIKLQNLVEHIKIIFVELAEDAIKRSGDKVSASKVSALTGLHRRDIKRIEDGGENPRKDSDILSRVIGAWRNNSRFTTSNNRPKVLGCKGEDSKFAKLVTSVSADLNPYTILYALETSGIVERRGDRVKLLAKVYIPSGNAEQNLSFLERDCQDLICAVEENALSDVEIPNLHLTTEFDGIPSSSAKEIRHWFLEEGSKFHEKARKYLAEYDVDYRKRKKRSGNEVRVSFCAFSRVDSGD